MFFPFKFANRRHPGSVLIISLLHLSLLCFAQPQLKLSDSSMTLFILPSQPWSHTLRSTGFSYHRRFCISPPSRSPSLHQMDLPPCKMLLWKGEGPLQASAASLCPTFCSFKGVVVPLIHLSSVRPETDDPQGFCLVMNTVCHTPAQLECWERTYASF